MPEVHESTPRETYTIAGESFKIPQPYREGHRVTAGEASQLNQVYAENVRNNKAQKVKDAKEDGTFNQEVFQAEIDDYCDNYEMGVRTGGGRSGDPVMVEAMNIARGLVRKAIVDAGKSLKDFSAADVSARAKKAIEDNPVIVETAKARVESVKEIAGVQLDSLESGEAEAPPASAKKGHAKAA